jgi:hypothetical protein
MIPRVSHNTRDFTGRYIPVPGWGTVSKGSGTVCENRTRGIPVAKPRDTTLGPCIPDTIIIFLQF